MLIPMHFSKVSELATKAARDNGLQFDNEEKKSICQLLLLACVSVSNLKPMIFHIIALFLAIL